MQTVGPLVARGFQWANDVLEKKIPSGPLARLACERFSRDLKRKKFPWYFDADEAERWLEFLSRLRHVKGRWSGQPFEPAGYQCFGTMNLYGWRLAEDDVDEEIGEIMAAGTRRFIEALVMIARKNGKSFWFGALGLGHLTIDLEPGAEVFCGATSERQAWEVFRPARLMCARDEALCEEFGIDVNAKSLWRPEDGSRFEPIIGNPGDGPSPSCYIADEYHEHRDRRQVESLETGMGARQQPMALKISTAGSDFGGPCYEEYQEGVAILERTIERERKFVLVFQADPAVAWDSDEAMRQANPNLGVSVSKAYLEEQRNKARNSPTKQAEYKTKHLNQWVGARQAWMNMLRLQRCLKKKLKLEDFADAVAYGGFDLATRVDLACFGIVIPDPKLGMVSFCKHYAPWEAVYGAEVKNKHYAGWADAGYITVTPGNVIDFAFIEEDVRVTAELLDFVDFGYDPYQATQFATNLSEEGFEMIELRPTPLNMSEPMMEIEAAVLNRQFAYNDPVLTWMFGNVVAKKRGMTGDLIMPDKERPEQKIDGVVALINAVHRMLAAQDQSLPEDYELTLV